MRVIGFEEGQANLDWLGLCDALERGHQAPKAKISDSFLYRGRDTLLLRSAWIEGLGIAVKAATVFPDNQTLALPTIHGGVSLYDDDTGALSALIDFHLVTKWKTAADSLLAARRLARRDTNTIVIIGAGAVARSMREAYGAGFPDARFLVWNRTAAKADDLANDYARTESTEDLCAAFAQADIICAATSGGVPVVCGEWLRPGQHVDLIGAFRPDMREADDDVLQRAALFVDSRETVMEHIGELKIPLERGIITPKDIVADFYQIAQFQRPDDDAITVFKNGGGAHLDLMTARYILHRLPQ